jgi:hypothetical protein
MIIGFLRVRPLPRFTSKGASCLLIGLFVSSLPVNSIRSSLTSSIASFTLIPSI